MSHNIKWQHSSFKNGLNFKPNCFIDPPDETEKNGSSIFFTKQPWNHSCLLQVQITIIQTFLWLNNLYTVRIYEATLLIRYDCLLLRFLFCVCLFRPTYGQTTSFSNPLFINTITRILALHSGTQRGTYSTGPYCLPILLFQVQGQDLLSAQRHLKVSEAEAVLL